MPGATCKRLILHGAGSCAIAALAGHAALAAQTGLLPAEAEATPATVELIDSSRLGCGQGLALWSVNAGGATCAFDSVARGLRITSGQDTGIGPIEAYATVLRTATGAYTPDNLLASPDFRGSEATSLFLVGVKGSLFDSRLKVTAEFTRTSRIVDDLLDRDWALADATRASGSSGLLRFDATLADRPGLKWTLTGEYRSVTRDYSVGRSRDLFQFYASPGSRLALATSARVGRIRLTGGIEQARAPYGETGTRKAGLDLDGIALRLVSRSSRLTPLEGSTLIAGRTRTTSVYMDVDPQLLVDSYFPAIGEMPFFVPVNVSLAYRTGESENRYQASTERYARSSLGLDGAWETPIGETSLSYWRDSRAGLTDEARSGSTETFSVDHFVRRGNWRFGLDASLSRSRFDGVSGFSDRSLSFGQSIAYSAPDGPEFRLQLGQDRGAMRMRDDSYVSADHYSQITASLDLSRYLQKRFERPDLRLTLDYRKVVDGSDSELRFEEELVDRWVDGYRREGVLMSFGMKL